MREKLINMLWLAYGKDVLIIERDKSPYMKAIPITTLAEFLIENEVVPSVYCEECKYCKLCHVYEGRDFLYCTLNNTTEVTEDHFCSWGEKKDDDK